MIPFAVVEDIFISGLDDMAPWFINSNIQILLTGVDHSAQLVALATELQAEETGREVICPLIEEKFFRQLRGWESGNIGKSLGKSELVRLPKLPRQKEKNMDNYICKIPSLAEMHEKWDYEIQKNCGDGNWPIWKESAIAHAKAGQSIPYYGILNSRIIVEATAALDSAIVQNGEGLVDEKTAYLSAFRTVEEFRGQGYFSKLFWFMLEDLKARGYKKVTLGVEPCEVENRMIYFHYGFTEFVKLGSETYPGGEKIDVIYYAKAL